MGALVLSVGTLVAADSLQDRALQGDVGAQVEVARQCGIGTPEWKAWLERAAAQGSGKAADELAWTGNWQFFAIAHAEGESRAMHLQANGTAMRESLLRAADAADQGFVRSQMLLAMAHANGYVVREDAAEACKWLLLAKEATETNAAVASVHERLFRSMSAATREEGERRAALFKPGTTGAKLRAQVCRPLLKVAALVELNGEPVGLINGRRFRKDEDVHMNVGGVPITLRATAITARDITVRFVPDDEEHTLHLAGQHAGSLTAQH